MHPAMRVERQAEQQGLVGFHPSAAARSAGGGSNRSEWPTGRSAWLQWSRRELPPATESASAHSLDSIRSNHESEQSPTTCFNSLLRAYARLTGSFEGW